MSGNYVGYEPAPPGVVLVGDTNPIGTIAFFHKVPDASWLQINGQNALKAAYPDLWVYAASLLTADQTANPGLFKDINATTFALPKFDGLFLRSVGLVDAARTSLALGIRQDDELKSHDHSLFQAGANTSGSSNIFNNQANAVFSTPRSGFTGGLETRPVNVALIPCIKALKTLLIPSSSAPAGFSFATAGEVATGTEAAKAVAPATQQNHKSAAKAWVYFNGTGVVAILASFNVASITDGGVGNFTANFVTAMANANYCAVSSNSRAVSNPDALTTTTARITQRNMLDAVFDPGMVFLTVFAD